MKRFGIIVLVIGLIAILGFAFAAEKKDQKDVMAEKQALARAVKVSMADALAIASKKVSGTVLNAEVENENGKTIYSFEILQTPDSKEIKEVNVDAVTGDVVAEETENNQTEAKEKASEMKESKEKGEKDEEGEKGEESKEKAQWEALKIKVDVSKLPAAVKATVTKEAADGKIESATTMTKTYEVVVKSGDKKTELVITGSGKLIKKENGDDEEKDEKGEKGEKGEKNEKD